VVYNEIELGDGVKTYLVREGNGVRYCVQDGEVTIIGELVPFAKGKAGGKKHREAFKRQEELAQALYERKR
jgi:hypothetical protein